MGSFGNQFRHVLRGLRRSPMFTVVSLVTIGLAVGANAAIFSVINGVLLKPLPYAEPERLVSVRQSSPALNLLDMELSPADYYTFRDENRTFEEFGLWSGGSVSITGLAAPEQVRSLTVTDRTLAVIGAQPSMGRWFTAKDDSAGSPQTAILTHGYWQRKFGGEASAIGKRILVDGQSTEIIGVMPQSFRFLDEKPDLIVPFQFDRAKTNLGNFSYDAIARLKPGVSLAQANADLARMIPIVPTKFQPPPGFSVKIFQEAHILPSLRPLKQDVVGSLSKVLWVLMGSIGVVLLIACANVANLLLVRAEGRHQELAIRAALGAGTRQIAGDLLLESLFLGLLGGAAGLGLAYGALQLLVKFAPSNLPRIENIAIDPAVMAFTLGISLFAGLIFGLIPVLRYASPRITMALRAGGRTLSQSREAHRTRNALVVLQMALALVLLIGSGLMIRTFQALRRVDPGFRDPGQLQTVRIYIPEAQVKDSMQAPAHDGSDSTEGRGHPGRLLGGLRQLGADRRQQQHRPAVCRRPRLSRRATAASTPLQVRHTRLLSNRGNPHDRRPRLHLDRSLRPAARHHGLRKPGTRDVAKSRPGARQTDSRRHEGRVAGDYRRGRRCSFGWRRPEAARHGLLAARDEGLLGQCEFHPARRGVRHAQRPRRQRNAS